MELHLTDDQEMLAGTTRKFLEERASVGELRARRHDAAGFTFPDWTQGAELGWTSLLVSEEDGGGSISDRPLADLGLLAFEFGRSAAPGPLVDCNILAMALSRRGTAEQKATYLEPLMAGEQVGGWCYAEPAPNDALGVVTTFARQEGDGFVLSGVKYPVESAAEASMFLVVAQTDAGLTQFLLPRDRTGIELESGGGVDLTRRFSKVVFSDVHVRSDEVLGILGDAEADVHRQLLFATSLEMCSMLGAMQTAFDITVEWSFDRYSFGRPLASYQALKHRFADMKIWLEASHALVDDAIEGLQTDSPKAELQVSAAKAFLSSQGPELAQDCVQMHGGIGVTFEHDLHLYLRRIVLGSQLHGTVSDHRENLVALTAAGEVVT